MKGLSKTLAYMFIYSSLGIGIPIASADNQTADTTPILSAAGLPFSIVIEQANFQLPTGIHSGVVGVYKGLWIFIAGRVNGAHGFNATNIPANFPADRQNTSIFVVNPTTGVTTSRSLSDPSSGLNQQQIDSLSVTDPQGYQDGTTLYMTGGYGVDTATGTFGTKSTLTAINLPGIVQWVTQSNNKNYSVVQNIQQISNPIFQITGGKMLKLGNSMQLVFGQNFTDVYTTNTGEYSEQVRQFSIKSVNGQLAVDIYPSKPNIPDPNFRRRDLNVVPVLLNKNNTLKYGLVAYAGVFTETGGVWTVPVVIDDTGNPTMADPALPTTFKQGMNEYVCANVGLYSRKTSSMYNIFFGGLSYGFYLNGIFTTDSEIPYTSQVTTIQMDTNVNFTQYLMNNQYPTILETQPPDAGNALNFGSSGYFIPNNISQYPNRVLNLDNIRQPTVIGYIVGGIESPVGNTTDTLIETSASPYVFKVTLVPINIAPRYSLKTIFSNKFFGKLSGMFWKV